MEIIICALVCSGGMFVGSLLTYLLRPSSLIRCGPHLSVSGDSKLEDLRIFIVSSHLTKQAHKSCASSTPYFPIDLPQQRHQEIVG